MKKTLLTTISIMLFLFGFSQSNLAQHNKKIKVLLVGTYHFANPGADKFNVDADDHMSEMRQKEILEVVNSLAKFKPEKVFIENGVKWSSEADNFFQQYKDEKVDINQKGMTSEKFQIGFRLAKKMNNNHIYSVDVQGKWFEDKVQRYADSVGMKSYTEMVKNTFAYVDSLNVFFRNHTVLENLYYLNNPDQQLTKNHLIYNNVFTRVGAGDNYIGADLVSEWYKRNLKIYSNILNNISPSDTAIVILFGNGHIHILRQLFQDNPGFDVVDTRSYLN